MRERRCGYLYRGKYLLYGRVFWLEYSLRIFLFFLGVDMCIKDWWRKIRVGFYGWLETGRGREGSY